MFVPYTVDVTHALHEGHNRLVVRLDVGLRAAADKESEKYSRMGGFDINAPRVWIRKAQFTFRWDWAPRLLTCGIWREVELRSYKRVALRDVCWRTSLQKDGSAQVLALVELENLTNQTQSVDVQLGLRGHGDHGTTLHTELAPGLQTMTATLEVPDPALWWPVPLGQPNLYDASVVLLADGKVLDRSVIRYGLREIALIREPLPGDEGESFILAVNGQKVFCKGGNWVPADALIARVNPTKYRELVRLAAEANFNMFRIWGGGIFEAPYFYQLCDEYGILVWHDFPYACSYYPDDDPDFLAEAKHEAELAVRRLRNHPSIALWCGNNENQWIHHQRKQEGKGADRLYGQVIYHEVLPEVCARLDPTRPYWPGSPWGKEEDPNDERSGNRHSWYVTILAPRPEDRIYYENWEKDRGKFITEFGILSPPSLDSLREFLPPDEFYRGSPSWEFHNNEFELSTTQEALKRFWKPDGSLSLQEYILYSQMIQAEALKFSLEHWRRRKYLTSGTLFWMYSDCWGAVGWTIVDYYLRKKPSYYYVRRAFAPILASIQQETEGLSFWLVNDTLKDVEGTLEYGLLHLQTGERKEAQCAAIAPANAATLLATMGLPIEARQDPGSWLAYTRFLSSTGEVVSQNRRFLVGFHFKALALPKARFHYRLEGNMLHLKAYSFVWQARIVAPRPIQLEDNYFDLLPGEERWVRLEGPPDKPLRRIEVTALN
jgi:beta-mannosidase